MNSLQVPYEHYLALFEESPVSCLLSSEREIPTCLSSHTTLTLSSGSSWLVYVCGLIWIQISRTLTGTPSPWGPQVRKCLKNMFLVCDTLVQDLTKLPWPLIVVTVQPVPVMSASCFGTVMQPSLNGLHLLLLYGQWRLSYFDIKTRMVARRQNKDIVLMGTCVSMTECSAACQLNLRETMESNTDAKMQLNGMTQAPTARRLQEWSDISPTQCDAWIFSSCWDCVKLLLKESPWWKPCSSYKSPNS